MGLDGNMSSQPEVNACQTQVLMVSTIPYHHVSVRDMWTHPDSLCLSVHVLSSSIFKWKHGNVGIGYHLAGKINF